MTHLKLFTPCFLLAVLVGACAGANDDPNSDDDGDGVIAADDRCQEAASSNWVDGEGCSESQDGDADGLPTDRDLCPGTAAGVAVDGNGCSEEQRNAKPETTEGGAPAEPRSGAVGDWTPDNDGKVAPNGFATFVLDPQGAFPVVLRTLEKNVTRRLGGFDLKGTVLMDVTGDEPLALLEAEVALDYGAGDGAGLESFRGAVRLPFPNVGFMKDSNVADPIHAAVGYDYGRNVSDIEVPLDENRKYFYFTFSAGLNAQLGKLNVSTPINQSATMALDPSDPAFFLQASLGGLMGPVDDASIGFSIGGNLQFEPDNTWGIEQEAASLSGHFWIGGQVNLNALKIPIAIAGNTVYDFDPNDDGLSFFEQPEDGLQFGTNAELKVSLEAALIELEVPVAGSTLIGRANESGGEAYYSGAIGNDWIPEEVPLKVTQQLRVAGHASSNVQDSYLHAEGQMSFDSGKLGAWTGLDLADLAVGTANLDMDENGVLVRGTVSAQFSPYMGFAGDVNAEGFFNGDPDAWYLSLDGRLVVSGIDLSSDAHALLSSQGMHVQGTFTTPLGGLGVAGNITESGVDLRGQAEVTIPIIAGKEELQWVTDQVICGTEYVTDGAYCGYETVTDGVLCGADWVTSGAECGYTWVKSGAECGWTYAQSGAECGYDYVTDGAKCGWDYFTDVWHCGTSCLFGSCNCSFARSCSIARSCSFENSCPVEATCEVPRTCDAPKSCDRVKSCETRVVIPDFDYGTFKGSVDVQIGTSGIGGSAHGEYCVTGGSCVPLGGGRVRVINGRPEACVTVGDLGEFCAGF